MEAMDVQVTRKNKAVCSPASTSSHKDKEASAIED
jgi:hypothetical protein